MRVNAHNPNVAFPIPGGDKNPRSYVSGGKVINPKLPGQALPPQMSWREQPPYVPEAHRPARAGASDHLKVRSIG